MKRILLILYVLLFFGIVLIISSCDTSSSRVDRENLNQHGKLAIGVFLGRTVENSKTKTVVYEFNVDYKSYENGDGYCYLDSEKAKDHFYFTEYPLLKGNEFVVLYDSLNPETSIIRLDYPLRDSTDFKSYFREFEKLRIE